MLTEPSTIDYSVLQTQDQREITEYLTSRYGYINKFNAVQTMKHEFGSVYSLADITRAYDAIEW